MNFELLRASDRPITDVAVASAIETHELSKDFLTGFWRPRPYRALDRLTLSVERGRGLRLPGSERRRQEHDAQAADAAALSHLRLGPYPRPARRRSAVKRADRIPARESVLLRSPHRRRTAHVFRAPLRPQRRRRCRPGGARARRRRASAPSGAFGCASTPRAWSSASVLAQALLNEPRRGVPRRADVGARPARPAPRAAVDAAAARSRLHSVLLARTSSRTPRRCAAGSRSWRRAVSWRRAGCPRFSPSSCAAGKLVAANLERRSSRAAPPAGPEPHGARPAPLHDRAASRDASRAVPARAERQGGARDRVAQPDSRRRSRTTSCNRWARPRRGRRGSSRAHHRARRRRRVQGIGSRPCALLDGRVRRAADGRVVPDQPADRRSGPEDHQGSRPGGHLLVRTDHRHLHRHRAGVEGSRAAQRLRAAVQAGDARASSSSANTPGWSSRWW